MSAQFQIRNQPNNWVATQIYLTALHRRPKIVSKTSDTDKKIKLRQLRKSLFGHMVNLSKIKEGKVVAKFRPALKRCQQSLTSSLNTTSHLSSIQAVRSPIISQL